MSLQDNDEKELQKKGDVDSMAWETYAVENLVVLENAIQDMVQQKDKLPNQLRELASVILKTLSGIKSLNNHKKDFERLLGEASTLVVIIWQSFIEVKVKYHSLGWPPPKLINLLDELVDTTCRIYKFMRRKSEKNLAKRVLLGCFGIRDLGKFNKYERRLGIMALCLQSKPNNINIHAVLLAVVHSRAQPQDEDSNSEIPGDVVEGEFLANSFFPSAFLVGQPTAEGSRLCEVGRLTSVKLANQRVKPEEDSQTKSRKAKNEGKDNPKHERDEDRSAEDKPPRRRVDRRTYGYEEAPENQDRGNTIRYEPDEANLVEERTSAQGSRSSNTVYSKTRKKSSQAYEDGENIRDKVSKRKSRSQTNPVTPRTPGPPPNHRVSISFNNESGIMINKDIGNTYNITTSE